MNKKLEKLMNYRSITSYSLQEGVPTVDGDVTGRLTDVLTITFNDGNKLKISGFCSGVLENVTLVFE